MEWLVPSESFISRRQSFHAAASVTYANQLILCYVSDEAVSASLFPKRHWQPATRVQDRRHHSPPKP